MSLIVFCTLFIFQFVGHRIGDYLIQSNADAINKSKSFAHRFRHCAFYSATIFLLLLIVIDPKTAFWIWVVTLIEHMIIDQTVHIIRIFIISLVVAHMI
jgi:hypothetical protein